MRSAANARRGGRRPSLVGALLLAFAAFGAVLVIWEAADLVSERVSGQPQSSPSLEEPSPEEEVARLNGRPVLAREVSQVLAPPRAHLEAPDAVDPRGEALDRVVRNRLFADEAVRRGIGSAPEEDENPDLAEATLVQSLIRQELEREGADDAAALQESVTDEEASRFYEEHQTFFDQLESLDLYAVVVEDPTLARALLSEAASTDDEGFAELVAEHSVDRASSREGGYLKLYEQPHPEEREDRQANGSGPEDQQQEAPPDEIDRVGRLLLEPGRVGLARGDQDGRYYVLRSGEVTTEPSRAAGENLEDLKVALKGAIAEERRTQVVEELESVLLEDAELEVYEEALYRLHVPSP